MPPCFNAQDFDLDYIPQTDTSSDEAAAEATEPSDDGPGEVRVGGRVAGSLFPGRHSKQKRGAIMKVLPFVRSELPNSSVPNPARLDKYGRHVHIRNGIEKAAEADVANKLWGDGATPQEPTQPLSKPKHPTANPTPQEPPKP